MITLARLIGGIIALFMAVVGGALGMYAILLYKKLTEQIILEREVQLDYSKINRTEEYQQRVKAWKADLEPAEAEQGSHAGH